MISTAGCSSLRQWWDGDPPVPIILTRCPAQKTYDTATLAKVSKEQRGLIAADPQAASPQILADYRSLRLQCAALEGKK